MFEFDGEKYNNEQEIIDGGLEVIYHYCCEVKGRWRDIEHLMVEEPGYGYCYAWYVIKGRYDIELETLYLMRYSGDLYVDLYFCKLVNA